MSKHQLSNTIRNRRSVRSYFDIRNNLDVKDFIDDNYNALSSTISEKIDKLEKNILFKNILGENIASYLIDNLKELEEK